MTNIIALDSGPAGLACDNPNKPAISAFLEWLGEVSERGRTQVILPEVVDYEVRRKLLTLPDGEDSVRRLDDLVKLGRPLIYVPITTAAMRTAARLWADARKGGYSTADPSALDGDVILAAQALEYVGLGDRLLVATGNVKDLARHVGNRARPWEDITP
jgi:predicted nucleic acid-binding protein